MEELKRLAKEYYQNTVDIKLFGLEGSFFLCISIPFLIWSYTLAYDEVFAKLTFIPMFIGGCFWIKAKIRYNKNLVCRLTFYTHLESKSISQHKAVYLSLLTSHIDPSIHAAMSKFRDAIKTNNENRNFVLDNGWYHFFRFIYDPESKSRILSLVIYLISLIAILTVIKPATSFDIFGLIHSVNLKQVIQYFIFSIIFILLIYFILVIPIMFLVTYIIVPLILRFSSASILASYFISELNKYSFLELGKSK